MISSLSLVNTGHCARLSFLPYVRTLRSTPSATSQCTTQYPLRHRAVRRVLRTRFRPGCLYLLTALTHFAHPLPLATTSLFSTCLFAIIVFSF